MLIGGICNGLPFYEIWRCVYGTDIELGGFPETVRLRPEFRSHKLSRQLFFQVRG